MGYYEIIANRCIYNCCFVVFVVILLHANQHLAFIYAKSLI